MRIQNFVCQRKGHKAFAETKRAEKGWILNAISKHIFLIPIGYAHKNMTFKIFTWLLQMFFTVSFHKLLLAHFSSFPLFTNHSTHLTYRLAGQLDSKFLQHLLAKTDDSEGKFCYQLESILSWRAKDSSLWLCDNHRLTEKIILKRRKNWNSDRLTNICLALRNIFTQHTINKKSLKITCQKLIMITRFPNHSSSSISFVAHSCGRNNSSSRIPLQNTSTNLQPKQRAM